MDDGRDIELGSEISLKDLLELLEATSGRATVLGEVSSLYPGKAIQIQYRNYKKVEGERVREEIGEIFDRIYYTYDDAGKILDEKVITRAATDEEKPWALEPLVVKWVVIT